MMGKNKMKKNIRKQWQQLRTSKYNLKQAESAIISVGFSSDEKSCLKENIAFFDLFPSLSMSVCESFNENKICDNLNCPVHMKNMHYILANEKYKQERKEFFKMLFSGRRIK